MYLPHTSAQQQEMLQQMGLSSLEQLFDSIPAELLAQGPLRIPPALSELELTRHMSELAASNQACDRKACFLGGGCYDHFVPAVVDVIGSRSEYYTAYTPYQAEASQGTLQAAFEFQTLMSQLTGLEVANASLYEGASAVVEAAFTLLASSRSRAKIVVSQTVHPEYRQTLATYLANLDVELATVPARDGSTDCQALQEAMDTQTAGVILQSPNFFGKIEPVGQMVALAQQQSVPVVQAFDPISLGLLRRPGDYGVDIAVAEGQALGMPMSYGGPFLGIFVCREKYVRKIPGRVVGQTVDRHGNRAFVLTLQTREQHIRREKATSNICTNQGLMALRAAVYLALLGPVGLKELAELCWHKAHHTADLLCRIPGVKLRFPGTFFKEFVLQLPGPADDFLPALLARGFHAGVPLGRWYSELEDCLLVAVTEKRTVDEIDAFAQAWSEVINARSAG